MKFPLIETKNGVLTVKCEPETPNEDGIKGYEVIIDKNGTISVKMFHEDKRLNKSGANNNLWALANNKLVWDYQDRFYEERD